MAHNDQENARHKIKLESQLVRCIEAYGGIPQIKRLEHYHDNYDVFAQVELRSGIKITVLSDSGYAMDVEEDHKLYGVVIIDQYIGKAPPTDNKGDYGWQGDLIRFTLSLGEQNYLGEGGDELLAESIAVTTPAPTISATLYIAWSESGRVSYRFPELDFSTFDVRRAQENLAHLVRMVSQPVYFTEHFK